MKMEICTSATDVQLHLLDWGRVTYSGEFSPIGRVFTLVSFLIAICTIPNFGRLSFHGSSCVLILTKKYVGLHLGDFFHGASFALIFDKKCVGLHILGVFSMVKLVH
jgi:hypothetical protein